MKVTIYLDGLFREYEVTEDQLINRDWNEEMADMLDSIKKTIYETPN